MFSPYVLNPLDFNPLKDLLVRVVDFDRLRHCPRATRLFVSATNVRSGKIRVFENDELSIDTVLASTCLPYIFKAVEIDGEAYWDGGFMGNPPLFPLIYRGASRDIVIVHINPLTRPDVPKTAPEIFDRWRAAQHPLVRPGPGDRPLAQALKVPTSRAASTARASLERT